MKLLATICLTVALALGSTNPSAAADARATAKPNLIFILADDYGIPGVGCYGGKFLTPHLDALAAGGVRFERCFAAPLCGPSRALCMTGRYAFRTGVVDNSTGGKLKPQQEVCIAKTLKQAGYATAVAGKWRQLSHFTTKEDAAAWGFDEFIVWGVSFDQDKGERYWDPVYNQNGQVRTDTKGKYGPDLLHEFAVDFIRRHQDKPFFLYYPMPLVHGPILRTPDSAPDAKGHEQLYADNVAYLDKLVGKLVAELDRLKLREKTLLVFTGDNGSVGEGTVNGRKVDGGKKSLLEGGSRVPLIANWPGTTPKGKVLKDLVDFSDFYATFAEVTGAKLPAGVTLDSHSFAPQLRGQPGQPRDWAYVQLNDQWYVRSDGWKLNQSGELFDMSDAPFREKLVPVAGQSAAAETARATLQAALDRLNPAAGHHEKEPAATARKAQRRQKNAPR
jgi:arylsulfatase A-like enzyme